MKWKSDTGFRYEPLVTETWYEPQVIESRYGPQVTEPRYGPQVIDKTDVSQKLGKLITDTDGTMRILLPREGEREEKSKKQNEDFEFSLKINNISYWKINGFLFFELNKKHYLYVDFGKEEEYETLFFNRIKGKIKKFGCTCLDIGKIEKPTFCMEQKIYKMMNSLHQSVIRFYEGLSLEDIVYDSDNDTYFILTKKKSIEIFSSELEVHWTNLFHKKSPYTFKGNEINSCEEMNIINGGGNYGIFNGW